MMEDPEYVLQQCLGSDLPIELQKLKLGRDNLEKAAAYCEHKYAYPDGLPQQNVLDQTKQLTLQSLASVAFNVNVVCAHLWKATAVETEKLATKESDLKNLKMAINIDREKAARREIGRLAIQSHNELSDKVIPPAVQEKAPRYQRMAIDYTVLDGLGHGVTPYDQERVGGTVNRTHSMISGDSVAYGTTQLNNFNNIYERWVPTQTPHGMYSQDTLRPKKDYQPYNDSSNYAYSTLKRHPQSYSGNSTIYMSSNISNRPTVPSIYTANSSISTPHEEDPLPSPPLPGLPTAAQEPPIYLYKARAVYDYMATRPDELNLKTGDIVFILKKNDDGWNEGIFNGVTGLFPDNYVEQIE